MPKYKKRNLMGNIFCKYKICKLWETFIVDFAKIIIHFYLLNLLINYLLIYF